MTPAAASPVKRSRAARKKPPAVPEGTPGRREHSVDEIAEKISTAILEHRLAPGTKLGEDRLAAIFNTSRGKIREVLARLGNGQIVEQIPQRGAFVAKPSVEQAREVFEARRLIEPSILQRLLKTMDGVKQQCLQDHLALEDAARQRNDTRAVLRLSGEFHVLLAELAGNSALVRIMRELSTLTCLIISLYDAPMASSCRADEHKEIVDAVRLGDIGRAQSLMLEHLDHIEDSLRLDAALDEVDIESILS